MREATDTTFKKSALISVKLGKESALRTVHISMGLQSTERKVRSANTCPRFFNSEKKESAQALMEEKQEVVHLCLTNYSFTNIKSVSCV